MLCYGNSYKNERCFLTSLYIPSSQNQGHFESLCDSFGIRMNNISSINPKISIIALDFNGKC